MRTSRAIAFAYLLHLAVPVFLLGDIAMAAFHGHISLRRGSVPVVFAFSAIWLCAGLWLFFRRRDRASFLRASSAPLTSIYSIYVVILVMEVAVRLTGLTPPIPAAREPWTNAVAFMDPKIYAGIDGVKHFTTNALGLRGPMPPKDGRTYRIVAIGGSTTICANLDDSEEWPHLVMKDVNAAQKARPVWVGNAGLAAADTVQHLVLMQWLPGMLHVDLVVFLFGVNDLTATLAFEGAPTQDILEKHAQYEGDLPPGVHWRTKQIYPVYRRLRLFLLAHDAAAKLKLRLHPPRALPLMDIRPFRQRRLTSPMLPLPDLSTGLREYRGRVEALAARCKDLHMRCLFLTQPTMWRADVSDSENGTFWLGYIGQLEKPKGFLSPGDAGKAMDLYNQALLGVCREQHLECFDIAAKIPKDNSAFFDEMHFNENGARLMARNLTEYLLSRPPFRGP